MSGSSEPRYPSPDAEAASRARGMFHFVVTDYSRLHRHFGPGSFVRSPVFHIGGYDWSILFFPGGHATEACASKDHAAVTLELLTKGDWVAVSYDMGLIDQNTGARHYVTECEAAEFDARPAARSSSQWHLSMFMHRSHLEEPSRFILYDSLVIKCTLAVLKSTTNLPPSNLADQLGRLLESGDGADLTFEVQGERFPAHRMLVAARSPVFKAELLGPMKEASADRIAICDMKPDVFKALFHFIYTDSLPSMDGFINGDNLELACGILVAADSAMDGLKLVCEDILSMSLEVETVTTLLVLADKYSCRSLKDRCLEFMISDRMNDVLKTEGYTKLKIDNPSLLVEVLEKAAMLFKI